MWVRAPQFNWHRSLGRLMCVQMKTHTHTHTADSPDYFYDDITRQSWQGSASQRRTNDA